MITSKKDVISLDNNLKPPKINLNKNIMNVKELKQKLENLPDDMMVGLLDSTTDDRDDMNYFISEEDIFIEDCWLPDNEDGEPDGKMLFISFENKLNENPI